MINGMLNIKQEINTMMKNNILRNILMAVMDFLITLYKNTKLQKK